MGGRHGLDFSVDDRIQLDFSLRIGMNSVVVWGSKITWFRVWIEISLVLCPGASKLTCVRVGIESDLTSVLGAKLTWLSRGGSKLTWFWRSDRN